MQIMCLILYRQPAFLYLNMKLNRLLNAHTMCWKEAAYSVEVELFVYTLFYKGLEIVTLSYRESTFPNVDRYEVQ